MPARIAAFMYTKLFKSSPKPPCIFQQIVSHLRLRLPAPEGFLTKVPLLNTFKHFATPTIATVVDHCIKTNISYKHCTSPSISLFYIIFMITHVIPWQAIIIFPMSLDQYNYFIHKGFWYLIFSFNNFNFNWGSYWNPLFVFAQRK